MSRAYLKHTNQCLSAAKTSLTQLTEVEASSSMLMGKVAQQAYLSSTLLLLGRAFDAYVKELASELLDQDPQLAVIKASKQASQTPSLLKAGSHPAEAWQCLTEHGSSHASWGQLQALKTNKDSWLNGFLAAYGELWWPLDEPGAGATPAESGSMIQLVDVSGETAQKTHLASLTSKQLGLWHQELKGVIDLHRQSIQEW